MKICRFKDKQNVVRIGLVTGGSELLDLSPAGITRLQPLLESDDPLAELYQISQSDLRRVALAEVKLLAPVEQQEVWAVVVAERSVEWKTTCPGDVD